MAGRADVVAATWAQIALVILLDTAALVVWDIGTRSPFVLLADIAAGLSKRSALARGLRQFAVGFVALIAAATIVAIVTSRAIDFTIVESGGLATALVLEQLTGPALRARLK